MSIDRRAIREAVILSICPNTAGSTFGQAMDMTAMSESVIRALTGYEAGDECHDEAVRSDGAPRPECVAILASLVVNSSRNGGAKDTWVLAV